MAEKKEKQWAVIRFSRTGALVSIVWFDAREDAREYRDAKARSCRSGASYRVVPMTRGPRA